VDDATAIADVADINGCLEGNILFH
jgi:hypothetical protein